MTRLYDCRQIQNVYAPAITVQDGKIELLKIALILTHACTLRCKLCAERTPYYKTRYTPTIDRLKGQIERYFQFVDYTMKLDLSGGEPLTRRDLPEFLKFLLKFRNQFGRARIVTNGTIEIGDELIDALQKFDAQADVLIDCYSFRGELLSVNAEKNMERLNGAGIACTLRKQSEQDLHCGGWVDFGDFTKTRSEEQTQKNYSSCAILNVIGGGARIKNGIITPCAVTQQIADFGVLPLQEGEYVNLFDKNKTTDELRKMLIHMFSFSQLSTCRYCDGMRDDSKRFPPAEQVEY